MTKADGFRAEKGRYGICVDGRWEDVEEAAKVRYTLYVFDDGSILQTQRDSTGGGKARLYAWAFKNEEDWETDDECGLGEIVFGLSANE